MSTLTGEYRHVPVMLEEVLRELDPKPGEVVCDCTLGGAGHSVELARRVAPDGLSIGIDQDDMALAAATERFSREVPEADFLPLKGNFGDLDRLLVEAEVPGVDCFLFDLGVSSPQLDIPQLVDVIPAATPAAKRRRGGHPARKTFQALRIEVNHELEVLDRGLRAAVRWANPGGRICVIAYHSLEDRIVKHVFAELSQGCTCPPDLPVCVCGNVPIVRVKTRKALVATPEEVASNPRSRSALTRVAVKLDPSGSDF